MNALQDSLVSAKNHLSTIERIHAALPKITALGERLQMIVCSATLHNFDVKKLAVSVFVCFFLLIFLLGKYKVL